MGPQLPGIVNSGISAMTKPRRDTPRLLGTIHGPSRSPSRGWCASAHPHRKELCCHDEDRKIDPASDGTACLTAQPSETLSNWRWNFEPLSNCLVIIIWTSYFPPIKAFDKTCRKVDVSLQYHIYSNSEAKGLLKGEVVSYSSWLFTSGEHTLLLPTGV